MKRTLSPEDDIEHTEAVRGCAPRLGRALVSGFLLSRE